MARQPISTSVPSPVKRYLEWAGGEGKIKFYDKEKGENIMFASLPKFAVLAERFKITGFDDAKQKGISSTEGQNIGDELTIFVGGKPHEKGIYQELKINRGYNYTKSLYIVVFGKDGPQVMNLQLRGAAFSSWMNFLASKEQYAGKDKPVLHVDGLAITGAEAKKKGSTNYFEPIFEVVHLTEEEDLVAEKLQKEVNEYLSSRGKGNQTEAANDFEEDEPVPEVAQEEVAQVDDLPF